MGGPAPLTKGLGAALAALLLALLLPSSALGFGPLSSFGSFGDGPGELDEPAGVAIGGDGTAYVADHGNDRVVVFGPDGTFSREFGGVAGDSAGMINRPRGIALGSGGHLYVADSWNRRIDVFAPGGEFLFAFGKGVGGVGVDICTTTCQAGESDGAAASMGEPVGVAFDAAGLVYVADYAMHRVAVFSADGEFVRAFGKNVNGDGLPGVCTTECSEGEAGSEPGEMRTPTDVAVAPDGSVVVSDGENNRVSVFSGEGDFSHSFGGVVSSEAGDIISPESIAVDAAGLVYVGEWGNLRVSRFELDGDFLDAFGEGVIDGASAFQICTEASGCQEGGTGSGPGAVNGPTGIAFDCRGAVFVAEQGLALARVERFGEPGTPRCSTPPRTEPVTPLHRSPPPPLVAFPDSKFQFGKLVLNRKRGTGTLFVFVPGPGRLTLGGTDIRTVWRNAPRRGGLVRMPVTPTGELKRKLRKKGRAKGRVRVSFKPTEGVTRVKRRPLLLLKRRG